MQADTGDRLHALDALRSLLMLLGVVLHSAEPYAIDPDWLVRDTHGAALFTVLTNVIHVFRMPAFFLLSGYFAALLLQRWSTMKFQRDRASRILVPFLATLATANLLQIVWLNGMGGLADAWRSGQWVGHLWFLAHLWLYCQVAVVCMPLMARLAARGAHASPTTALAVAQAVVLAALLVAPLLSHFRPTWSRTVWLGSVNPVEWLSYLPYFLLGMWLHGRAALMARFVRPGAGTWALLFVSAILTPLAPAQDDTLAKGVHAVAAAVLALTATRATFGIACRWFDKPSVAWRYLSDASYTIYLLHHLVVVVAASALLSQDWPAPAKFGLVATLAFALPLAFHHVAVLQLPWLRWLLNGKGPPTTTDTLAVRTSSGPRSP